MSDSFPHFHPDARQALSLPPSERCEFAERSRWIDYPAASEVLQRLLDALTFGVKQSVLLNAAAQNGMTSLLNRLLGVLKEEGRALKVSIVSVPKNSEGLDGIHRGILQHLRQPASSSRTKYTDYHIVGVLAENAIDLLMVEDYPLKGRRGSRLEYGSVMQLKSLYNAMDMPFRPEVYSIPIVVIMRSAEAERVSSYPELARRFEPLGLPLWSWNEDFRAWLGAYERWLPLEEPSQLALPGLGKGIIDASDRTIGSIVRIIRQAAAKAIRAGKRSIGSDDLAQSASIP